MLLNDMPSSPGRPAQQLENEIEAADATRQRTTSNLPTATDKPAAAIPRSSVGAPHRTTTTIHAILPGGGMAAANSQLTAYIAAAQISPDDLAEQADRALRGGTGAGAVHLYELANVEHWTTASVNVSPENPADAVAISQVLPPAALYEVAAYDYNSNQLYHTRVPAEDLTATRYLIVPREPATGLNVRLLNAQNLGSALLANLQRKVSQQPGEAQRAGATLPMLKLFNPLLADAYMDEESLLLSTTRTTTLAPLLPDPEINLRLATAAGIETGPLTFALEPNTIRSIDIDCAALFQQRDVTGTAVHARVLLDPSDSPLSSALVTRLKNDMPAEQRHTDSNGNVTFDAVPLSLPTQFEIETTATSDGIRPLAPKARFTFDPPASPQLESSVTWHVRPYSWLVMNLPNVQRHGDGVVSFAGREHRKPYPVYILQKLDAALEQWNDTAFNEFVETNHDLSISVSQPGEYRIAVACSPIELYYSTSAKVGAAGESHVQYPDNVMSLFEFPLRYVDPDGKPTTETPRGPIIVSGTHRGLPSIESSSLKSLPRLTEPYEVEISIPGYQPIQKTLSPTLSTTAPIDINLKPV